MRPNCPVCGHPAIDQFEMKFIVPDGWTLPDTYTWKLCQCGFIWADNDATQADYDEFYRNHYDPHMDAHDYHRQDEIAHLVYQLFKKDITIIDFGGGDGYLVGKLKEYGFNASVCNVDDELKPCDLIICSQLIEHIYDLELVQKFYDNLNSGGCVLVETPEAQGYSMRNWPDMLDYYPTHLNHFTPTTLSNLFAKHGFSTWLSQVGIEYPPTNAPMFRAIYKKDGNREMFDRVKAKITDIQPIAVSDPVIVYGLGDLALHVIAKSGLNIKSFVDNSPIYKGVTINGIPVLDHIEGDYPILVIGKRNRDSILVKLKDVKNKVITL